MPQCEQIEAKLAAFVEETADKSTRIEVEAHLSVCPHCQMLVREQRAMRHQLHMMARQKTASPPSSQVWERACAGWDAHDARQRHLYRVPWALVGACLLLLVLSTVWARLSANQYFPITAILQDYRSLRSHPVTPAYVTSDADRAALWLRTRMGTDIPPINLSLLAGDLLGADVLGDSNLRIGRLLYRTPENNLVAVYLVPGHTHFVQTRNQLVDAHEFQVVFTQDNRLYGWEVGDVGYGMIMPQAMSNGHSWAIDAAQVSAQPAGFDH